jgi:hypothetical protein
MKLLSSFLALPCLIFFAVCIFGHGTSVASVSVTSPFNACTFTSPAFALQSFAGGAPSAGCASWSVVRGRAGCNKVKGVCPFCVVYPGDHLQMWLPEFFIEVTTAPGESVFTLSADGLLLKKHLSLADKYWKASVAAPLQSLARAQSDSVTNSMFWHARILVMPYANLMGSFTPLPGVLGTEAPTCFAALSEFIPRQWNDNFVDAPYAFAWSPIGSALCNSPQGAALSGGLEAVKGAVSEVGLGKVFQAMPGEVCARPVGYGEASLKVLRPSSDPLAPLTMGPQEISSKLCMGAWGNLLPRSGWTVTGDPLLSAMQAAYRFTSAAADFNLNDNWKLRADDKWQIVFPQSLPGTCFKPGAPFPIVAPAPLENIAQRTAHELNPLSERKGTYVIAVWRKRETCEEPFETIGGWSAAYQLHLKKNAALCSVLHTQGGEW